MNDQISFASNRNALQKYKVVLVGDQNVGKSSIIGRYIRNQFDPTKNPTIGIDFISRNILIQGKYIRLQLWDTAGQQRFKSLIPSYLKDAQLAIVVFDLTNKSSVQNLNKWIDFTRQSAKSQIKIFVVGNKNDLQDQVSNDGRKIAQDIAQKQADNYKQVSAKTGNGIDELFKDIIDALVKTSSQKKKDNIVAQGQDKKLGTNTQQSIKNPVYLKKNQVNKQNKKHGGCCLKN